MSEYEDVLITREESKIYKEIDKALGQALFENLEGEEEIEGFQLVDVKEEVRTGDNLEATTGERISTDSEIGSASQNLYSTVQRQYPNEDLNEAEFDPHGPESVSDRKERTIPAEIGTRRINDTELGSGTPSRYGVNYDSMLETSPESEDKNQVLDWDVNRKEDQKTDHQENICLKKSWI